MGYEIFCQQANRVTKSQCQRFKQNVKQWVALGECLAKASRLQPQTNFSTIFVKKSPNYNYFCVNKISYLWWSLVGHPVKIS